MSPYPPCIVISAKPCVGGGAGEWQVAAVSMLPREPRAWPCCVGRGFGVTQTLASPFQTHFSRLELKVGLAGTRQQLPQHFWVHTCEPWGRKVSQAPT